MTTTALAANQGMLLDIAASERGSGVGAFFDLDRTLIAGYSVQDLLVERLLEGGVSGRELLDGVVSTAKFASGLSGFGAWVATLVAHMEGASEQDNRALGQRVFENRVARRIYPEARVLVDCHLAAGHTVAMVSSATRYQTEPVAADLGIATVLCTELEVIDGRCTGRILEPPCYGEGKAVAIRSLAADRQVDLEQSFFYSDSDEDLPALEAVGHPRVLNPNLRLDGVARRRGWPRTRFSSRGMARPSDLARMATALAVTAPTGVAALTAFAWSGNPRQARNLFLDLWGELASVAVGIELDVTGEHNLWARRPAVFVFNHQSALDLLVMVRLLRRDITGIAKKELEGLPVVAQIGALLGAVFVDRGNRVDRADAEQAVAGLEPAIEALRTGTSVVIAPEGTRSATDKLGPFKKGAFHLAMQAAVPVIPVVIRNATARMPKGSLVVRAGEVAVEILEPIDTSAWQVESIDEHVAQVRGQFLRVLGQTGQTLQIRQ